MAEFEEILYSIFENMEMGRVGLWERAPFFVFYRSNVSFSNSTPGVTVSFCRKHQKEEPPHSLLSPFSSFSLSRALFFSFLLGLPRTFNRIEIGYLSYVNH